MTGTALGQAIALLLSPIITRLFTLNQFSTFEQYAFMLSILSVIVAGKYEYAVMQPKDKEDARHMVSLAVRIVFYASAGVLVILLFTSGMISNYYHSPDLKYLLWTLPVALFCAGVFNVLNYWFSRQKNYKVAATSKLLYSAASEPVKVAFGWIHPSAWGLVGGTVIGHFIATAQAWWKFLKDEPRTIFEVSKKRMRELAHEYRDYPRFAIWGSILNNLAQWAHVAVFSFYYGERAIIPIAFIALSRRIFFNPLGILSSSYGQVFYQRISQITEPKALRVFYVKNLLRFLVFAALIVIVIQLLPPNTLGFIFGEQWTDALKYLQVLCYWYALNFAISSLSFIFNRLRLQWYTLIADIVHFIVVIAAFAIAHSKGWNELDAVKAMVWAKVVYLFLNGCAVIYFLKRNEKYSVS